VAKGRRKQAPIFSVISSFEIEAPAREPEGRPLAGPPPAGDPTSLGSPGVSVETGLPVPGESPVGSPSAPRAEGAVTSPGSEPAPSPGAQGAALQSAPGPSVELARLAPSRAPTLPAEVQVTAPGSELEGAACPQDPTPPASVEFATVGRIPTPVPEVEVSVPQSAPGASPASASASPQEAQSSPAEPGGADAPRTPPAPEPLAATAPTGELYPPLTNSLGMSFVSIPAAAFIMGSPEDEPGRNPDEIPHEVTISRAFYLQTTPVTQGQWRALMDDNPSIFSDGGDDCPVEGVSWNDCQEFIQRLNARGEGTYRLPKEAEWEYACRAGSPTAFANGEITQLLGEPDPNLDAMGWYCGNSGRRTHPVGQKAPNRWGLYDMHGNVSEWCQDWYGPYPETPQVDPAGPPKGMERIFRSGSLFGNALTCRSAYRAKWPPQSRSKFQVLGFRLVRET